MRRLLTGGAIVLASGLALTLGTGPAHADWHGDHDWDHGHHGHWAPPPPRYYPPRAYYAPPPVYYAPPPAYYAPPPVYYGAPGASITLSFP